MFYFAKQLRSSDNAVKKLKEMYPDQDPNIDDINDHQIIVDVFGMTREEAAEAVLLAVDRYFAGEHNHTREIPIPLFPDLDPDPYGYHNVPMETRLRAMCNVGLPTYYSGACFALNTTIKK